MKAGKKWKVINKHTGRVLGSHDTSDDAQKQLAAVQINYKKEEMVETEKVSDLPSMIKIPRGEYDLACPHCKEMMSEKDFSFKYIGNGVGDNKWTHECNPHKPFMMPSSLHESYGIESKKSGFSKDETDPPSDADKKKVKDIVDDKSLPDIAEDGKAYVVKWADGRGVFACKSKEYLGKWLDDTGGWACIISIKYGEPKMGDKKLRIVKESNELIMKLHYEKKIDLGALESFWLEAVSRQENYGKTPEEKDRSNPKFWKGVKQYFQKLVDSVDVQEAKEIIMNRDKFNETSNEYLDALQSDNYVKAKELFPKIVDAKIQAMLNNRGKEFLKQMNKQRKDTPRK